MILEALDHLVIDERFPRERILETFRAFPNMKLHDLMILRQAIIRGATGSKLEHKAGVDRFRLRVTHPDSVHWLSQEIREHLFQGLVEIDMVSCGTSILSQFLEKRGMPVPRRLREDRQTFLDWIQARFGVNKRKAKRLYFDMLYQRPLKMREAENDPEIESWRAEVAAFSAPLLGKFGCSADPSMCVDELVTEIENRMMTRLWRLLDPKNVRAYIFDAFVLADTSLEAAQAIAKHAEDLIEKELGYNMRFSVRQF